ncbi:MAG: filamentous hemagglutinin N-terminal domain-containing protein, partial [Candidatus Omnitrophota bacterium]
MTRLTHKILSASALVVASLFFLSSQLYALPKDPEIVAGEIKFEKINDTTLNITASDRSIANYGSFDIAANETVNFFLPDINAFTLSRVTGGAPTQILGHLNANGNLVFVNADGITFGNTADVNVGGLMASTRDIQNKDFLEGRYVFGNELQNPGKILAQLVNNGMIRAREGGFAVLIGSAVENTGTIVAPLGTVSLSSGDRVTVGISENGKISIAIDEPVSGEVFDSKGNKVSDQISNKGTLEANGGHVLLKADAARNIFRQAVNLEGHVRADKAVMKNGVVEIVASGPIRAAADVSAKEGEITIASGESITLSGSYRAPGGSVAFGAQDHIKIEDTTYTEGNTVFSASRDILVNADVTTDSGDLSFLADADFDGEGAFLQAPGTTVQTTTFGNITIQSSGQSTLANIISAGDVTLKQAGAQVEYLQLPDSTVVAHGSLTIESGVTLKAANTSYEIFKNWINFGVFFPEISLVRLSGPEEALVLGDNEFNDFSVTEPGKTVNFEAGKVQKVAGTLTLTGGFGKLLLLRSTQPDIPWKIDARGARDIVHVEVMDSTNINIHGPPLTPEHSKNSLNNTGWDFSQAGPVWTGNSSLDWSNPLNWDGGFIPGIGDIARFSQLSSDSIVDSSFAGFIHSLVLEPGYQGTVWLARDLTVSHDVTLAGGTFAAGSHTITVGQNWSNFGGHFEAGTSTVVFNDALKVTTISGENTFFDFTSVTPEKVIRFEAGKLQSILGTWKIRGAYALPISLFSTLKGSQWMVDPRGPRDISYSRVEDSYNRNPEEIIMTFASNRGNSYNWDPVMTWTNEKGSGVWSEPENWTNNNGIDPPGPGDDVVFDATSIDPSIMNADFTINNLTIDATYTGTISLRGSLAVNGTTSVSGGQLAFAPTGEYQMLTFDGAYTQAGGIFSASFSFDNCYITFASDFELSLGTFMVGGTFTPEVSFFGDYTHSGGTFNGGSAAYIFKGNESTVDVCPAGNEFADLTISKNNGQALIITAGDTLRATHALHLDDGVVNAADANQPGTIESGGTLTLGADFDGGTGTIKIVDGTATLYGGHLPNLILEGGTVDAGSGLRLDGDFTLLSGVFRAAGTLYVKGNWSKTGGTADLSSATVDFTAGFFDTQTLDSGYALFYDIRHTGQGILKLLNTGLRVDNFNQSNGSFDANNQNVTVNNNLILTAGIFKTGRNGLITLTGSVLISGNSEFHFESADIDNQVVNNTTSWTNQGGKIVFSGSGSTTIFNSIGWPYGSTGYHHLTLSAAEGTFAVAMEKELRVTGDFVLVSGSILECRSGSTVSFTGDNSTINVPDAGASFQRLTIFKNDGQALAIAPGDTLTVNDTLTLADGELDGGTISLFGILAAHGTFDGGTGTIDVNGNSARDTELPGGAHMPNMILNTSQFTLRAPSTGTVTFEGDLSIVHGRVYVTQGGNISIAGDLSIGSAVATLIISRGNVKVFGNWSNGANSLFDHTGGTVEFAAASPFVQTLDSGGDSFYAIVHSGTGTLQLDTHALTITNSFSNDGGTFDLNGRGWVMTGATFSNAGTVQLTGTGTETLTGVSQDIDSGTWVYTGAGGDIWDFPSSSGDYFNLIIEGDMADSIFTAPPSLDINGDLTVSRGRLVLTVSTNLEGDFTIAANDASVIKGVGIFTFDGIHPATYTDNSSGQNIGKVVLEKTDVGLNAEENNKLTLASSMTVDTLSITGYNTLDLGSTGGNTLTLANVGPSSDVLTVEANGHFLAGNGTVDYAAINSNGSINVALIDYHSVRFSGPETYYLPEISSAPTAVTGSLTIEAASLFNFEHGKIDLAGDWENHGSFSSTGSIVTLNGSAAQRITSGHQLFDELIITNASTAGVTFEDPLNTAKLTVNSPENGARLYFASTPAGSPPVFHTVRNTLSLTGGTNPDVNMIVLGPATANETWYFSPPLGTTVTGVNVSYSSSDIPITANNSRNGGNNANWIFPGVSADRYWIATAIGSWSTPGNWSGGLIPTSDDDVYFNSVSSLFACTIDTSAVAANLTIEAGYTGGLTIASGGVLTVAGELGIAGGLTLTNNGTATIGNLTGSGTWQQGGNSTLNYSGAVLSSTLAAGVTGNTVNFTGATSQTFDPGAGDFFNITHSGAGTLNLATNDLTVLGNLDNSGGIFDNSGLGITVEGDLNVIGTLSGAGIVDLAGSGASISGSGTIASPVTVSATHSIASGSDLTFSETLTIQPLGVLINNGIATVSNLAGLGTWQQGDDSTLNYSGASIPLTLALTAIATGNTVNYIANIADTTLVIVGTTYYNLKVGDLPALTGARTYVLGGPTTVKNQLTVGHDSMEGHTQTFDADNKTLTLPGDGTPFVVNSKGAFLARSSTVDFNGAGTQVLDGSGLEFYNLTHSGTGTLGLGTNPLVVSGAFVNSSGSFLANNLANTVTGL